MGCPGPARSRGSAVALDLALDCLNDVPAVSCRPVSNGQHLDVAGGRRADDPEHEVPIREGLCVTWLPRRQPAAQDGRQSTAHGCIGRFHNVVRGGVDGQCQRYRDALHLTRQ